MFIFLSTGPRKRQIYNEEKELLKIIEKYCYERKIKLTILCKFFKNTRKGDQEISFYKNNLKKEYEIIINDLKERLSK